MSLKLNTTLKKSTDLKSVCLPLVFIIKTLHNIFALIFLFHRKKNHHRYRKKLVKC